MKLTDPNRRGLLGQGSVLSLTSVATRTSPVLRGKFILTTFLNTPPPPPPPNVPTLEESAKGARAAPKTVREQMELHRSNPACASCHRIIDPVGFALENFNSVGQWRNTGRRRRADRRRGRAGRRLEGGRSRRAAQGDPEPARGVRRPSLTERMLTYALGRGVEPSDMPVVRSIVKRVGAGQLPAVVDHHGDRRRARHSRCAPSWSRRETVNQVAQARVEQP